MPYTLPTKHDFLTCGAVLLVMHVHYRKRYCTHAFSNFVNDLLRENTDHDIHMLTKLDLQTVHITVKISDNTPKEVLRLLRNWRTSR